MRWPQSPGRDSRFGSPTFDIDWPYRERQMMDGLIAVAGTGTIDERALPSALTEKRIRIGHSGTPFPPLRRKDWTHVFTHPRWRYSRHERRALKAATVRWPATRDQLAAYANWDILEAEWDARFPNGAPNHPGVAAAIWREANVTAVANVAAESVRRSRIWKTDLLDEHQARIDVDALVRHIAASAYNLWRTHADTHLDLGAGDETAWNTLIDTIDALTDYARGLNGRTDLLLAYREILRLDNDTDKYIRVELGLSLDDPHPLNRTALDDKLKDELDDIINSLAAEVLPLLHCGTRPV
jgi:hypothetical protein